MIVYQEDVEMRLIACDELIQVSGGEGVSGETIGCAIGGAIVGGAGLWGAAAGCVAGAYVANNWSGWIGDAFGSLNSVNLTM